MRFWFQGGWRWKYINCLRFRKKKKKVLPVNNYITSASLPVRKTREPSVLPEPRRRTVCGRWLYVVVAELLFVFINRTHLTFNLTSCFFLRLLLHFVTIKASRRAAAALWCLVLSVCDGGGGASLGFLTQLLSFCGRAISFLLHGLQDSRSQRTRAVLLGNASERDRSELLLLNKPPPLSVLFSGKAFIFFSFLSHGFSVVWPEMRTKHTISKALLSH